MLGGKRRGRGGRETKNQPSWLIFVCVFRPDVVRRIKLNFNVVIEKKNVGVCSR